MNTEELRVQITTVADTTGAARTQQALQGVQQQAARTQGAAGGGVFGAAAANSALRFAGALTGVNLGLSIASSLGERLHDALDPSTFIASERTARAVSAAYGQMAGNFQQFATALQASTGFSRQAILEAALSARTLSANYGLTIEQTQRLIRVSADLASVRGIGVAEAFERVQSAIRGEAEASEFLGLTLNDTFLKNNALNGSVKNTFETMTDAQKAQVRYAEVLRQTAQFSGLAQQGMGGLEGAQREAAAASEEFSRVLGQLLAPQLAANERFMADLTRRATELARTLNEGAAPERQARQLEATRAQITTSLAQIGLATSKFGFVMDQTSGEMLNVEQVADRLKVSWDELQAVLTEDDPGTAARFTGTAEGLDLVRRAIAELQRQAQQQGTPLEQPMRMMRTYAEMGIVTIDRLSEEMKNLGEVSSRATSLIQALGTSAATVGARAAEAAASGVARVDAAVTASIAAGEERRRLSQTAQVSDPRDAPGARAALARLALLDQLEAANRDLIAAQDQLNALQQENVQITGAQAQIALQFVGAQQQLVNAERDLNSERLRSRLAALPATEALEDLRYLQQRAQLIAQNRDLPVEQRRAARREGRELARREPGVELAALEATRAGVGTERQLTRVQGAQELLNLQRQQLEAPLQAIQQQNNLLTQVAQALVGAREQRIELIVNHAIQLQISGEGLAALSPDQIDTITQQANEQFNAAFHAARTEAERASSARLSLGGR